MSEPAGSPGGERGTATEPAGSVPFDLDALRASLASLQPIGISEVADGPGALGRLGDLLAGLGAGSGEVVVLAAATPIRAGGAGLREVVTELTGGRSESTWLTLGPPDGSVHADEQTVARAVAACAAARCVVTVGSGTITDIGKAAAPPGTPLVAVQTATSVNGYADPFSVLLRAGVKRTVPTRWPDVLVIDTDVLLGAPVALNRAGVGDMAAMFTASADWYLASLLHASDPPYRAEVSGLVRPHGDWLLGLAGGFGEQPGQVGDLARLLTLSGIGMGVAGATAPASGMEHAVSHLLEMAATATGGPASLHGEQVGVASIVAAVTWTHVRARIAAGGLDRDVRLPGPDVVADRIHAAFAHLDPTGAMAAECLADYTSKMRRLASGTDPLATLRAGWENIDATIGGLLTDPLALAGGLRSAGLPTRFADLPGAADQDAARWAVAHCALQRQRFGVADLAMLMGAWEPEDIDAVLATADGAAACAVGRAADGTDPRDGRVP